MCMKILALNINQNTVNRGLESFLFGLKNEMVKRGMDFQVLSQKKFSPDFKTNSFIDKIFRRLYLDKYSRAVLFFTLKSIARVIKEKPDIMIPANGGWQVLITRLMRLFCKFKIVIIGEAGIGYDDKFNLKHGVPNLFVALTHEQEKWAKAIAKEIKVVKIPNGIDIDLFSDSGEKVELNLEGPVYFCVSAFDRYKNIDKTISAVSKLMHGSLVILGDGSEKENLLRICHEKLGKRFILKKIEYKDLPKWYRATQVFTLVSGKQEAFGNVYLEAMASGLPVVATDDEKRREIVGEAGLFTDPDNIEEYSQALAKAAMISWGKFPRKQAEKFSWQNVGERYEDQFLKLLGD